MIVKTGVRNSIRVSPVVKADSTSEMVNLCCGFPESVNEYAAKTIERGVCQFAFE